METLMENLRSRQESLKINLKEMGGDAYGSE